MSIKPSIILRIIEKYVSIIDKIIGIAKKNNARALAMASPLAGWHAVFLIYSQLFLFSVLA